MSNCRSCPFLKKKKKKTEQTHIEGRRLCANTVINKGDVAMCADKHVQIIMLAKQISSSEIFSESKQGKSCWKCHRSPHYHFCLKWLYEESKSYLASSLFFSKWRHFAMSAKTSGIIMYSSQDYVQYSVIYLLLNLTISCEIGELGSTE